MKIKLSEIKPSPKPIRSSWDEEKMEELKQSLLEEGQVEPIGVHENTHGYIVVWGHRRVEAAKRAGWSEIEGVVIPQDEVNNLIQAGIENLAGEDMSADDKADWVDRLIKLGLSQNEISRRSTVSVFALNSWRTYKREKDAGVIAITPGRAGDEGVKKVLHVAAALGDDLEAKKAVLAKSSDEKLNEVQTREVAQAYRDAPTPEVKAQVLKMPIVSRDTSADILRRARMASSSYDVHEFYRQQERKTLEEYDAAVKSFIDMTRTFKETIQLTRKVINKFSPEGARFSMRMIDQLIDELETLKEELENVA